MFGDNLKDCLDGQWVVAMSWQDQARAAGWSPPFTPCKDWQFLAAMNGWSPPVKTLLRVVYDPRKKYIGLDYENRPLTPAETNDVAENIFRNARVDTITLASGLKVILEENDAKG